MKTFDEIKINLKECYKLIPIIGIIIVIYVGSIVVTYINFPFIHPNNWGWLWWILVIILMIFLIQFLLALCFFTHFFYFSILRRYIIKLKTIIYKLADTVIDFFVEKDKNNELPKKTEDQLLKERVYNKINNFIEVFLTKIKSKIPYIGKFLPEILQDIVIMFLGIVFLALIYGVCILLLIIIHKWDTDNWGIYAKEVGITLGFNIATLLLIERVIFIIILVKSKCFNNNLISIFGELIEEIKRM